MIVFFVFILILSIYDLYYIKKNNNNQNISLIIIYIVMTALVTAVGVYYYLNQYGNSLAYYIFKLFKIHY